jgi:tRNA nucleotidyltransferase (CCA-adding enzyme)
MNLPKILYTISQHLHKEGAKAIVVGGSVRDHFLNVAQKDYDIEVYGLKSEDELREILSQYGSVNTVGKSFGVLKLSCGGDVYDFSFPRKEKKVAHGHRGFDVEIDGSMEFAKAAKRRDFTINAMGYDIQNKEYLDPFGGVDDIKSCTLRHIDDDSFIEDPLRLYRAVQFCARFGYKLADNTYDLCAQMIGDGMLGQLPKERIYEEFKKLLLSPKPSVGFELMRILGILPYFPELEALIGVPQSPKWHPEGDVWVHTLMSVDSMVGLLGKDERQNLIYMFAILCHDLGKATTTTIDKNGQIRAQGHDIEGVELTRSLMGRLTNDRTLVESIVLLVKNHMRPSEFFRSKAKDRSIRKLATKVSIEELVVVAKADYLGRTTQDAKMGIYEAGDWLLERSKKLNVKNNPPQRLIQGRDLIGIGLAPSAKFGEILDRVYSLQIEGEIASHKEALRYIKEEFL